jgi:hypothetical protein
MTAAITIGLTVYAMTTKKDFTILGASGNNNYYIFKKKKV